jgi:hypothetical protein
MPQTLMPGPALPALQLRTPNRSYKLITDELENFFRHPLDTLGTQFILKAEDPKDNLLYEVVKVGASKVKGQVFEVQYADCESAVEMDSVEMKNLLEASFLIDE